MVCCKNGQVDQIVTIAQSEELGMSERKMDLTGATTAATVGFRKSIRPKSSPKVKKSPARSSNEADLPLQPFFHQVRTFAFVMAFSLDSLLFWLLAVDFVRFLLRATVL